jgi:hypothetical protein
MAAGSCRRPVHPSPASTMDSKRVLQTTGFTVLAVAAVAALGAILVRDQISRHQRDLFSPHPLRRLAALSYLGSRSASVDLVMLLRDFVAWEPRPLIRRRAGAILVRLEDALATRAATGAG